MARPTKLTPDLMALAERYPDNFMEYEHAIPSVVGLTRVLNVARSTLYRWGEENEEFQDILDAIQDNQEFALLDMGLKGLYNANITKLALGKHGYHDKQDLGGTGEGGGLDIVVRHVSSTTEK